MKTLVAMLLSLTVVGLMGLAFGGRQFIATHLPHHMSANSYGSAVQDYNRYMPTIVKLAEGVPVVERNDVGDGIRGKIRAALEQ